MASSDGKTRKGDTIAYSIEVANSGNTCLTDVQVTDGLLGGDLDCATGTSRVKDEWSLLMKSLLDARCRLREGDSRQKHNSS